MTFFARFSSTWNLTVRVVSFGVLIAANATADWPQFRGPSGSGIASQSDKLPTRFGPGQNERWSVAVGPGHSSPIIVNDSIYLTTFGEAPPSVGVVSLNREDGSVRWSQTYEVEKLEKGHPSFNPASGTPACDGNRILAYFGSYGLICLNVDGTKLWEYRLPLATSFGGNAASPIIHRDLGILYRATYRDHFLCALDLTTGEQRWRIEQEEPFTGEMACTACPIVFDDQLIVHTARSIQAFQTSTGDRVWHTKCATTATSTPVIAGSEVIVATWNKLGEPDLRPTFPDFDQLLSDHDQNQDRRIQKQEFSDYWIFHRPEGAEAPMNGGKLSFQRVDTNRDDNLERQEWQRAIQGVDRFRANYESHGVLAIPLQSSGQLTDASIRTLATQGIPEVPSPIVHQGILYLVKNGGLLTTVDVDSGKRLNRIRTRGRGTHYASPIIGDDKLYCTAGNGAISVLSTGTHPKVLAVNQMGENTYATPAIDDGVLYVRTQTHLRAFAVGSTATSP